MNTNEAKPRRKRELTIDRKLIEWYPTVDAARCQGCRSCVECYLVIQC